MGNQHRFLLLSLLFIALAATSSLHADWNFLPAGQPYIYSISADSSGQQLYATVSGGGVWFSDDRGQSWEPISQRFWPGWIKYALVATATPTGDTLIATTYTASDIHSYYRMYNGYSYDGGQSFQPFAEERVRDRGSIQVWHAHRNVWFHLDGYLLSRSTDFGQTWGVPDTLPRSDARLFQDEMSDSVLYVINGRYSYQNPPGCLWRSMDLGSTWVCLLDFGIEPWDPSLQIASFIPLSNGDLLVLLDTQDPQSDTTLLVSTDSGQSWEPIVGSGMQFCNEGDGFECLRRPGRVFVNSDYSLARSDDYGRTWSDLSEILLYPYPGASQEPFGGNVFVLGDQGGCFQSSDGGETWDTLSTPPIGGNGGIFIVDDEAVFCTVDQSPHWQLEPPYSEWREIVRPEREDTLVSLTPIILKSGDTLACLARLDVWEQETYVNYSCMIHSRDNGASWTLGSILPFQVSPWPYWTCDILLHDSQARIVVPIGSDPSPYRDSIAISEDWGQTWNLVAVPGYCDISDIEQTCEAIYALKGDSSPGAESVQRSTDGGVTWYELSGLHGQSYDIRLAVCGEELFLPNYDDNRLWHWNGQSWSARGSLPHGITYLMLPFEIMAIPGDPPILMGVQRDSAAVWISRDRGDSWERAEYQLPYERQISRMSSLTYDPFRNRVWVATGVGACWLDASELAVPDRPLQFKPADYTLLSVYPNPFNDQARIRFDVLTSEPVEIKLYDLQGRLVQTLADEAYNMGRHEIAFDARGLASGTYFVHRKSPTDTKTQKILLIR